MDCRASEPPDELSEELHAYLDGRLDAPRRARVEARIRSDRDLARLVEEYRAQALNLELLGRLTRLRAPRADIDALRERFAQRLYRQKTVARGFKCMAVAAVLLSAGWMGWLHYGTAEGPLVARQPSEAGHLLSVERELAGAEGGNPILDWIAQQVMGKSLPAPDLQSLGFQFAGGRVLPTSRGPAAQLFYESSDGDRVMLYLTGNVGQKKSTFTFVSKGELSMFYWQSGPFIYSLIGRIEQDRLMAVAEHVNAELSASGGIGQAVETPQTERAAGDAAMPALPANAPEATGE
jgi:anti-sigma factor RsiW